MRRDIFANLNFKHLFFIQSLAAMNDNIVKNSIIIMITYYGIGLLSLGNEQLVTLSLFLFVLPMFLFSSYSGKLADYGNKTQIIRYVKIFEVFIMLGVCVAIYFNSLTLMMFCLFCLGLHSTVFAPIKYSIIAQYVPRSQTILAIGYVEFGTFVGILLGQLVGTWFMVINWQWTMVAIVFVAALLGLYSSYKLEYVPAFATEKPKFYKNPIKDAFHTYKAVIKDFHLKKTVHAISWFWAFGGVFTTQLVIFIMLYMCGDGKVFSFILFMFIVGIGLGSIICAKMSKSKVVHRYALYGGIVTSIGLMALLIYNPTKVPSSHSLEMFFLHKGIINTIICFVMGAGCGAYSVTCYSELQLLSTDAVRSQTISAVNILNAFYMVIASIVSGILLLFMNVWWLFFVLALINVLITYRYYKFNSKLEIDTML